METNQLGRCFASCRGWVGERGVGEGETERGADLGGRYGT